MEQFHNRWTSYRSLFIWSLDCTIEYRNCSCIWDINNGEQIHRWQVWGSHLYSFATQRLHILDMNSATQGYVNWLPCYTTLRPKTMLTDFHATPLCPPRLRYLTSMLHHSAPKRLRYLTSMLQHSAPKTTLPDFHATPLCPTRLRYLTSMLYHSATEDYASWLPCYTPRSIDDQCKVLFPNSYTTVFFSKINLILFTMRYWK